MTPSPRILLAAGLLTAALALTADANASVTVKQRTLLVTGTGKADKLTLRVRGRFVVAGKKKVARRRFDEVLVRAGGGDDRVRVRGRSGARRSRAAAARTPCGGRTVDGARPSAWRDDRVGRRRHLDGSDGRDTLTVRRRVRLSPDGARVRLGGLIASRLEQVDVVAGSLTTDDLTGTMVQAITADVDSVGRQRLPVRRHDRRLRHGGDRPRGAAHARGRGALR